MRSGNNNMWLELVDEMSKAQDGKEVKDRDGHTYMIDKMAVINNPVKKHTQFSDTPMYEGQKHSTHLMSDDDNLTAWPIIFQDEEGNWFEGGRKEAEKRGEIYKFDTKKEMTDFAREGNWKKKHGGNHHEAVDYNLSDGMEVGVSDTDEIIDKYADDPYIDTDTSDDPGDGPGIIVGLRDGGGLPNKRGKNKEEWKELYNEWIVGDPANAENTSFEDFMTLSDERRLSAMVPSLLSETQSNPNPGQGNMMQKILNIIRSTAGLRVPPVLLAMLSPLEAGRGSTVSNQLFTDPWIPSTEDQMKTELEREVMNPTTFRDGGSVWDRKRYSTSAKKYRRGGESLPKYQIEGEVKEKKLTALEKRKKSHSVTGEYYGGVLAGYEIQDFWCFECDMNNQTWREGFDPSQNPEVSNWRSGKGFDAFDLLNWFYHTQYNIPFPGTNDKDKDYSAVDFSNRSTWEGQNYGYVRGLSAYPLGTQGVPGHEYESESWFPNKSNTGNTKHDTYQNKRQAYAMSRDLMNIYPGATNPWYFFEGQPYNNENESEQSGRLKTTWSYGRAIQLHNAVTKWFNEETYLHNMGIENPEVGDLQKYLDKVMKQDYSYKDENGEMVTVKDEDMQDFLKYWKKETGEDFFSELTSAYDNVYQKCEDGAYGCKGSPYLEHQSHATPVPHYNLQSITNHNGPLEVDISDYNTTKDYSDWTSPGFGQPSGDHSYHYANSNIPIYKDPHENMWYDRRSGQWVNNNESRIYSDNRSQYEIKRDKKVMDDWELKNNIIDMNVYANPNALGRPFGTQSLEMDYGHLRDLPITAQEASDYISATEGILSTKNVAQWGVPGTAALKTLSVVSKIPLTMNKIRTGYGLFDKANKVRNISNVVNTSSKVNTAHRAFTVGDAANIGFGAYGYSHHGPSLLKNIGEGDVVGASGDLAMLGLYSWGVPGSIKTFNRGFLSSGRNITKPFNFMPSTSKEFGTMFPNTFSGFTKEGKTFYDESLGPAIQNLPRYNLFNKTNQYNILKNMNKYEKNYFSPYKDVTNAPNFMPNIIK